MTVSELITALEGLEPDALVVLAKEAEGEHYSPLHHLGSWLYVEDPGNEGTGEVYYNPAGGYPHLEATDAVVFFPQA